MHLELMPVVIRAPYSEAPRTPGIHVSRVLRSLAVKGGHLDKKWISVEDMELVEVNGDEFWERLDPVSQIRMSMGLSWERHYIEQVLRDVVGQPGEMCVQGVYMTPDGESLDVIITPINCETYVLAMHEVKLTYKSINTVGRNLEKAWLWVSQLKAYCKGAGTTVGYLHVLFVCGDYSRPIQPMLLVWRIEFEQNEIDQNWEDIMEEIHVQRALMDKSPFQEPYGVTS